MQLGSVLEDKGLKSYLNMMDQKVINNRVMLSFVEKASADVQKNEKAKKAYTISGGW
jgi:hypothetical protein